jgi:hypothetical protein
MHGTRLAPVVVSVVLLGGCVSTPQPPVLPPVLPPINTTATAETDFASLAGGVCDVQRTLAYWNRVREIARRKSSEDFKTALGECKRSVGEIRNLPAVGVDPELLAHAENLARHLDRVVVLGQFADEHPRETRKAGMGPSLIDAWEQANDATSRLKGLRAKLSNRYGTEFPPMETP